MILPSPIVPENASSSKDSPTNKLSGAKTIAVIGGGPAGLMAAEAASAHGHAVTVFDTMPSLGRKFLMAGRGGLNVTHSEPLDLFYARYGESAFNIKRYLENFGPAQITEWCAGLGIDTFVGSSGRIFPKDFKAAPLLRAWVRRLRAQGVKILVRHRWQGWSDNSELIFDAPGGRLSFGSDATILALGGGSWPSLGSDGKWLDLLHANSIGCTPLKPANCGFDLDWSDFFSAKFAGSPLKSITLSFERQSVKGDLMLTKTGIEGGPVYALSASIRDEIACAGTAVVYLDLCPDRSLDKLIAELSASRGSRSVSAQLKRILNLSPPALSLARECANNTLPSASEDLARLLKAVPLIAKRPRPLAEAISSGGGVRWDQVDENLQIKSRPGLYVAGEMLDWEAPTGGYLLTGCLSLGYAAGNAAAG